MVGFCEVEKMGKDYKVKEIDLSGVKFIPGKYYYIDIQNINFVYCNIFQILLRESS